VVDDERRLQGLVEAEEVSRLAERNERELKAAIDTEAPRVKRDTWLREVLPLFVERDDVPVAVCAEDGHLEGVIVRGSLIAGLTTSTEQNGEEATNFSGVGGDSERPEGALLRSNEAGRETDGGR
jgi:glycine betaine/proline transport system ATP-binding protein